MQTSTLRCSALLLGIALGACGPSLTGTAPLQDGLVLSHAAPERVSGSYARENVVLLFDLVKTDVAMSVSVRSGAGDEVLSLERTADGLRTGIGGRSRTTFSEEALAQLERLRSLPQEQWSMSPAGITVEGDAAVSSDLSSMPEYAALPWLSRSLAERGITGNAYPASLALHQVARDAAGTLGVDVKPQEVAVPDGSATAYCTAYPNRNDKCYGMCGLGCSCWKWVCGDCCLHPGCVLHDWACRHLWVPGAANWCTTIGLAVALRGC